MPMTQFFFRYIFAGCQVQGSASKAFCSWLYLAFLQVGIKPGNEKLTGNSSLGASGFHWLSMGSLMEKELSCWARSLFHDQWKVFSLPLLATHHFTAVSFRPYRKQLPSLYSSNLFLGQNYSILGVGLSEKIAYNLSLNVKHTMNYLGTVFLLYSF